MLEVTADDIFIDVLAAGFDAGVRYDERLERDMIALPIGPRAQRFVTAGARPHISPRMAGRPIPATCSTTPAFGIASPAASRPPGSSSASGEVIKVVPQGPLIATSGDLQIGAAIQGLGMIRTFDGFVADAVARGAA